jgi:hypothetical protein
MAEQFGIKDDVIIVMTVSVFVLAYGEPSLSSQQSQSHFL